ncbi:MAG: sensor histidine kinase [Acidimicrobiales bacterium]
MSTAPDPVPSRTSRLARRPRPVQWLTAHPVQADALLAALVTLLALGAHLLIDEGTAETTVRPPTWWSPFVVVLSTVPLAWRRRRPVEVLVAVSIPEAIIQSNQMVGAGFLNVLIAAYSLGAYTSGRRQRVAGSVVFCCLVAFVVVGVFRQDDLSWGAVVSVAVLYLGALILGDNMRRRRERADELVERAERAERERELLAAQQVQQERTRIAREMHDVVAHSLSVMIIQAGAARRQVRANPDRATESLETIEATGREAMTEMRRILGVLRAETSDTDAAELAPQPSLATLDDLVSAAGDLPISLHTEGDLGSLPTAVELSAYRVVQEALTNVRRHAGRVDHVDVRVERTEGTLTVVVEDDGRGAGAVAGPPGFGLVGMRERVGMFGGRLDVGPRPGGGWRVRAVFPERGVAA